MKFIKFICVILCFIFVSCSQMELDKKVSQENGSLPQWVKNPVSQPGYIYGVGISEIYSTPGEALSRARELARVELIKQLKVKISGETTASVSRDIAGGKSNITRTLFNYAKSSIEETEVPGIKIVKTAVLEEDKQVFALAELDIAQAELALTSSLMVIDQAIDNKLGEPVKKNKIKEIKRLVPALKLIEKRRKIVSDLKLINKNSDEDPMPQRNLAVIKKTETLLDGLVFVVRDFEKKDEISSGIISALSKEGVRVRRSGMGDFYVNFSASLDTILKNGVYFTFARGSASVEDNNKEIIGEFSSSVKSGSGNRTLSRKRSVEKLAENLGNSIAKSLLESI